MVGAPGPPALPPRGPDIDVFCVGGGRSQILVTASQGAAVHIFCVDGGRSQTSSTASQGAAVDVFLHWW
jgi:phage gp45-like